MTEKEFGKLTRQQMREFFALSHSAKLSIEDYRESLNSCKAQVLKILSKADSWGWQYCLSEHLRFVLLIECVGYLPSLVEAMRADDKHQALLDFMSLDFDIDNLPPENDEAMFMLVMSSFGSFESLSSFGLTMHQLLTRVMDGDDQALFQAVICDRAVVSAEPVAHRICLAQALGDESFMNKLAKAMTRTKPARPRAYLDDTRRMLSILSESKGLDNLKNDDIQQLICDDLEALPDGYDSDSLAKQITKFRNLYRK